MSPDEIVSLLRSEARLGSKPSDMLRLLCNIPDARGGGRMVMAFRRAFLVPISHVALIGGWFPNGSGEITDARIDEELGPAILAAKPLWDQESNPPPE